MFLANNGKAIVDIFVAIQGPQTKYAARELRYYLGLMTGVPFEIVENPDPEKALIRLEQIKDKELGDDGFRFASSDKGLTITGGNRGILYGVYELLEELGCRFFTAKDEKIPFCEKID